MPQAIPETAERAYDVGRYHATGGIWRMPPGTWLDAYAEHWTRGRDEAIAAGEWETHHLVTAELNRETIIRER